VIGLKGTIGAVQVLHVLTRSHRRGAELAALELTRELDALGYNNRVVALRLAADGGRVPEIPSLSERAELGPLSLAPSVRHLRRLLASEPADVVMGHGGWATQVAVLSRRRDALPIVWQRILGFPPGFWRSAQRRWWQLLVRRIDATVALTEELADEVRRLGFKGPIWTIANSRRPGRFLDVDRDRAAIDLRREIGVANDIPLLGFVGHLVDQKRPERVLDVLACVRALGEQAHLVVVGDGPLRSRFEQEIRARGISEHVSMLGHRDDVERILGGLDLMLLTSDAEGVPGVAIEAQMAGCPVVTFPVGGVSTVVDEGQTGIVLDRSDTKLMAARCADLLRDPEFRRVLSEEGRRRAPLLSTNGTARTYASRLTELVEHRTPPATNGLRKSRKVENLVQKTHERMTG